MNIESFDIKNNQNQQDYTYLLNTVVNKGTKRNISDSDDSTPNKSNGPSELNIALEQK